MNRNILIGALVVCVIVLGTSAAIFLQPSLETIHQEIEKDYLSINHIDATQLKAFDPEQIVLLDVREDEEFDVSHIQNAISIAPNASPEEFERELKSYVKGKHVVFYCSVGRRSSALLDKMQSTLASMGAASGANLEGGIFSWVNDGHSVEGEKVHPYNQYWGRLIENKALISYEPEEN